MSTGEHLAAADLQLHAQVPETRTSPEPRPSQELESAWSIAASDGPGSGVDAALAYAAAELLRSATERTSIDEEVRSIVARVAELAKLTPESARRSLFRHAARAPELLSLDPSVALDIRLRLLVALAPVTAASVWLKAVNGRVELAQSAGPFGSTRRCKSVALETIGGQDSLASIEQLRNRVHGFPLTRLGTREGALVVRLRPDDYPNAIPFLEEFAKSTTPVLERELLLRLGNHDARTVEQTYERRLVRTAFDLHDGALQEIAALGAELQHLRRQIATSEPPSKEVLCGRIDDVVARVVEVDESLRDVVHSLETSTLSDRPLVETLRREADSVMRRSNMSISVRVVGRFDELSQSQRIAIVRIVQEALSNARDHGGATDVQVTLTSTSRGLRLHVTDNGAGFDVKETALAAARRGRLGVVGMRERVKLLGGTFSITSTPGAGTRVAASIPAWRPLV